MISCSNKSLCSRLTTSFIVTLSHCAFCFGQQESVRFTRYGVNDGMHQATATAILEDHLGFIWVGTMEGLHKFDGTTFRVYKNNVFDSTSLGGNWVECLFEDSENNLWIGTRKAGLNRFLRDREVFVRYRRSPRDSTALWSRSIRKIFEDSGGDLWIAATYGLHRFDRKTGTFKSFIADKNDPRSIDHDIVMGVCEDIDGYIWIGTHRGLNRFDPKNETFSQFEIGFGVRPESGIFNNKIQDIRPDPLNSDFLWVATFGYGLVRFNRIDATMTRFRHDSQNPRSLGDNEVRLLFSDSRDRLWIATAQGGLNRFEPGTNDFSRFFYQVDEPQGLASNAIFAIEEDRAGALWVGTDNSLERLEFDRPTFGLLRRKPNVSNSLIDSFIFGIAEGKGGRMWFGTIRSGLAGWDPKTNRFTHRKLAPGTATGFKEALIWSVYEDSRGLVWIGTPNGVNVYLPEAGIMLADDDFLQDHQLLRQHFVMSWCEDQEGGLWFTGSRGAVRMTFDFPPDFSAANADKQALIMALSKTKMERVYKRHVHVAHPSQNGKIWFGSDVLQLYDPKTDSLKVYHRQSRNPQAGFLDEAWALYEDPSGILWLGTELGLSSLDPETDQFAHYLEDAGLPNGFIKGVLPNGDGKLWLSSNNGLYLFDPQNPKPEATMHFDLKDGVQGKEFNRRSYHRASDGTLYFGGPDGVTYFKPDVVRRNEYVPPVVLTEFRLFDKKMQFDRDVSKMRTITLDYDQNDVSFEFAALNFTNSDANEYAYMLEGYNEDWVYSGARRTAVYTNLDPGEYVFRAKGSNNDGVWNETGLAIELIVLPPFWERAWFRVLIVLLFLAIIAAVFRWRLGALRRAKQAQEAFSKRLIEVQEQERKRIGRELHDGLGQDLLLIKNGLEFLKKDFSKAKNEGGELSEISEITQEAVNDVRQIAYDLHPHQLESLGLRLAIKSIVNKLSQTSKIEFETEIENIDNVLSKDREIHIYRIVQEALSNAVKHSEAVKITVRCLLRSERIELTIIDDGKGFKAAESPGINGGFGLFGLAERVRILGGRHKILSRLGRGTEVFVQIPVS